MEELAGWQRSANTTASAAYVCELKIDGAALALTYQNGLLVRGCTRGTSERGRARGLVELLTTEGIDRQLKPKGSPNLVTQIEQPERELQRIALLNPTSEQVSILDRKSSALISQIQKTLKEQQIPSAALRAAQLQLWQTNPDSRYWAAFTLQGEWLP